MGGRAEQLRAERTHDMMGRPKRGGGLQSAPTEPSRSETSARVGFCPQALKRSPRLALGTRPLPLLSNKAKASRYWSVEDGYPPKRLASATTIQRRHSNTGRRGARQETRFENNTATGEYHQKKSNDFELRRFCGEWKRVRHDGAQE